MLNLQGKSPAGLIVSSSATEMGCHSIDNASLKLAPNIMTASYHNTSSVAKVITTERWIKTKIAYRCTLIYVLHKHRWKQSHRYQTEYKTRKLCYRKDDHVMCLIYECLESFWYSLYVLHSNFSSILMRFRYIAAFVLQHATFPPTSSLPKISPCSLGERWMTFGLQRAKMSG